MLVECRYKTTKWDATVEVFNIDRDGQHFEARIKGRGSLFHAIIGEYSYGRYLCIPGWGIGCELAQLNDIFWNEERLSKCVSVIDAITLSRALSLLEGLCK